MILQAVVTLSSHAYQRCKERAGFSGAAARRMAGIAFERGIPLSETKGTLRRYLCDYLHHDPSRELRIYGAHIYVFHFGLRRLITLLNLPNEYHRQAAQLQKPEPRAESKAGKAKPPRQPRRTGNPLEAAFTQSPS